MLAGGVEFHADGVHAAHHSLVEALFKLFLVYIVLVLAHADAFRVDLHQFGQRIHQATANADGTTHSDVVVRELVAGDLGGGIH